MKRVPFKIIRVSYAYNFRFLNISRCLIEDIINYAPDLPTYRGKDKFDKIKKNSAEGFQFYLKKCFPQILFPTVISSPTSSQSLAKL